MADKIRLLPEVVANQIAAGEVVNRPASVVKEMMENAIDAGARRVRVNFRDGGKELIQLIDDGCGMSPADARLAFDRHATSKIRTADDLYALRTFGFRGEALASIAAVAQVELRTRRPEDELGTEVTINGGLFAAQKAVACPAGSQFFVRNLFYNVPARRRFLEKSTASAKQIRSEFARVALCYPEIAFELYADDAPVYCLEAATQAGRIVDLVGRSIKHNLLEIDASTSIASLRGYIGRPAAARRRNTDQYLFVNGRYFKSPYLVSALMRGYEKLVPQTAQPSFFLFFTIDPSRIDVNIHPQKTEVKFADEEAVWQILNAAVRETLAKSGAVPMMDFDSDRNVDIPVLQRGVVYEEPRAVSNESYNPFGDNYIDPSAPDPNRDFRGFDVPYRDSEVSDVRSSAAAASRGRRAAAFRPGEEFDEIPSGSAPAPRFRSEALRPDGTFGLDAAPAPQPSPRSFDDETIVPSAADAAASEDTELVPSALGFTEGLPETTPAEPFAAIPAENLGEAAAEEESFVDFASSSIDGEQQELAIASAVPHEFRSPVALGGGLLGALLDGRFVVVDIRRATERVAYEALLARLRTATPVSQQLLFPERLVPSAEEYALLEEHEVELAALGFDIAFAQGALEVRALPSELPAEALEKVLNDLLQRFAEPIDLAEVRRAQLAAVLAAASAGTARRTLSPEEAASLLDRLAACDDSTHSPRGKRLLAEVPLEELRAKLG